MEIAIITSLLTKWDMNIYAGHLFFSFIQIQKKSFYDYNSILLSFLVIVIILAFYKKNYPLYFRKYFSFKNILYLGNHEDFFFRSNLFSFGNIIPLILYSTIISFFTIFVFEDVNPLVLESIINLNLFYKWLLFSIPLFSLIFLRILIILFFLKFIVLSIKIKKIYLLNFLRLTILLTLSNIFLSYLVFEITSFQTAIFFLNSIKFIIIILRPIILYFYFKRTLLDDMNKIVYLLIFSDVIPSLLLYDSFLVIDFFNYIIDQF